MSGKEYCHPYITSTGTEYIIKFKETPNIFPGAENLSVPLIEVIIFTAESIEVIQTSTTLLELVAMIRAKADLLDAVYYSVCSDKMILRSEKRMAMSHQEYRSHLFKSMFLKANADKKYINREIIISDPKAGNQYIHLMTGTQNLSAMDIISEELKKYDK
ncbi:hypothetical protein [Flavobacterium ustbae]|uniref:hypothetical protein n=1 Tax=Flavobacterium ustbae TaxID=2488790 RepID=UPI000F77BE84|nr:hypothetical protein [Flavobacterium ustbae]